MKSLSVVALSSRGPKRADCYPEEEKMTSAEMLKTRIPPGYLFHNRGRLGHEADWVLVPDQRRIETKEKKMNGQKTNYGTSGKEKGLRP